jgi:uncharacterized protein YcfL
MKTYFLLSIIIITAFSCNTKKAEQKTTDSDTVVLNRVTDSSNIKIDGHYFWSAELAPTSGVPLQIGKVSNDTMFVKISNSKYLTQQMGSSGPEVYMAEVTYNLTEIAGINFVAIMFKEGDHARPGIFSRTDFVK